MGHVNNSCGIWGSHGDVDEDALLLAYDVVSLDVGNCTSKNIV